MILPGQIHVAYATQTCPASSTGSWKEGESFNAFLENQRLAWLEDPPHNRKRRLGFLLPGEKVRMRVGVDTVSTDKVEEATLRFARLN
jgi:hypothetical protein